MEEMLLVPNEAIATQIHWIRGEKVMLAFDLANLYGVPTYPPNEAVKRNMGGFPDDFLFQLTKEEWANLTSQFAMSSSWGVVEDAPLTPLPNTVSSCSPASSIAIVPSR